MVLRSLLHSYVRVMIHPREFFEDNSDPVAIEGGFAVFFVGVATVLATLVMGLMVQNLFAAQGYTDAAAAVWGVILEIAVVTGFGVAVVWIISAVVLHVIAKIGSGDASFGRTLGVTGYGMLPAVLNVIVAVGFVYLSLSGTQLSGGPSAVTSQLQAVLEQGGLLREAVNWGFLLWQAAIWAVGLRKVHEVDWLTAAVGSGIVMIGQGLMG